MIKKLCLLIILVAVPILLAHHGLVLADAKSQILGGAGDGSGGNATPGSIDATIRSIINILTVAVGIAGVVMIIVAGFKYITSAGNADKAKSAKNTLLYVVIGLVIVALAQSIAHFALTESANPSTGTTPAGGGGTQQGPGGGGHQT